MTIGILLKMMGRPEESVLASEIVFNKSTSNFDKSVALSMRAGAHVLIGNVDIAIELYNRALDTAYYQLDVYLPLIECHKEKGLLSKNDWTAMLNAMEQAVEKFNAGGFITDAVHEDLKSSYLHPLGSKLDEAITSDIYWAMYTAAEKGSRRKGEIISFLDVAEL